MRILEIIRNVFAGFPKKIVGVYPYYEFCYAEKSKYTIDLWRKQQVTWSAESIIPMLRKDGIVAYYKITRAYYTMGGSHSDWAFGDDGKSRDMILHHIEKEKS